MNSTIVELRVSPPFERPHMQGVLAQLTIPAEAISARASIRARRYQSMDWMEHGAESEWQDAKHYEVDEDRAQAIRAQVLAVSLPLLSTSSPGIHETAFRLKVFSGAAFCEFNWWREAPPEWVVLEQVVREIQAIANDVLGAVQPFAAADGFAAR